MTFCALRWVCFCTLAAAFSSGVRAAETSAPDDLPALDTVLSRYIEAIGGQTRLEKLNSRIIEGEVELSLVPGTFALRVLAKAPDRQLSVITIPGFGEMLEGYDGTNAWVKNPLVGVADRPAAELPKVRRDAQFNRELRYQKIYPDLAVKGVDRSGPEPLVLTESRPDPRSLERFYFSQTSGLLVRQDSEFEGQNGRVTATAMYEDYREINGGIRMPHAIRICARSADGVEMSLKLTVKEVRHNVALDDAAFRKPAS